MARTQAVSLRVFFHQHLECTDVTEMRSGGIFGERDEERIPGGIEAAVGQGRNLTVGTFLHISCGSQANEGADRMAKLGAGEEGEENRATHTEMKTIIESLYRTPHPQDSYHQLSRSEQVVIFHLRTGHSTTS